MKWALLALLLAPLPAWADPFSLGAALASAWAAVGAVTVGQALGAIAFASSVYGAASQRKKARKAAAKQKAQYNASLEDRTATLLQANPPHRVIYGRCIVGGDVVAMFTSDKTGTRQDGSSYTKPDALKHLVIVVSAHEVQAINDVLIDGVSLGPLDVNGWVTSGEFFKAGRPALRSVTVPASSYVDVSPAVQTLVNGYITSGSGLDSEYSPVTLTLSLGNTRITNPEATDATASYSVSTDVAMVRASMHLGTSAQAADAYLNGAKPTEWTANHRLRGLAYVVVTLDLEEPRFQGGPPQISFDVSGKKVLDTRTGTTAYSENPALIIRDFLTSVQGLGVAAGEIDTAACNAAANACDARLLAATHAHATTFTANGATEEITCAADRWFSTGDGVRLTTSGTLPAGLSLATTYYVIANASRTVFKLASSLANAWAGTAINITSAGSGTHTVTWYDYAAYTCNGAVATDGSGKEAILEDLAETMGGTATYGANWMIHAGAWVAPVMALDDDDLDGQIEIVQAGAGMDAIINGVRGQFVPTGKGTPTDFDSYQNATFLASDGQELWEDVALPFVGNKVRAANLARIKVEQARDGLVIRYPAKLVAWPLQIGDRVTVTSTEYAWSAKTFRVTDWGFSAASAVVLTLQEDAAAISDLADAVSADPAPNTGLPSPWTVAALANVDISSGDDTVLKSGTAPIVPRVLITWDAITDPYVTGPGGAVEILWQRPGGAWMQQNVPGDATSAYITGVAHGEPTLIALHARNGLGEVGPTHFEAHTVSGATVIHELRDPNGNIIIGANGLSPTGITGVSFFDGFEYDDGEGWETLGSSTGEMSTVAVADSTTGGRVLRIGNNSGNDERWLTHKVNIPFDPSALYRVKAAVRRTAGTGRVYLGVFGIADDGVSYVNTVGANSGGSQHYIAAESDAPGSGWTTYTGYIRGTAATGDNTVHDDPSDPAVLHEDVRYIRPTFIANSNDATGTMEWAYVSIERLGGAIGTEQLGPYAVTTGSITDSSQSTGSSGSPGASTRAFTMVGPAITTAADDELDIVVGGFLNETFWSQSVLGKVELYVATSTTFGGSLTEIGTRCKYVTPIDAYTAGATNIPLDMTGQYVPGAATLYYNLRVSVSYVDAAGSAKTCAKDFTADLQWRVVRRKR
jgi:hypothetical protein